MNSAKQSQREVASSVAYALSLTALLSAVFFATVAINPKDTNYGVLPWAYCAGSIVLSIVCGWLSHRLGRSNQTVGDGEEPSPSITRPTHAV